MIISCIGESTLIGYLIFSYNNIATVSFSVALVSLIIGNMIMLVENRFA